MRYLIHLVVNTFRWGKVAHSSTKASNQGAIAGREEDGPDHGLREAGGNIENKVFDPILDHRPQVQADGIDVQPGDGLSKWIGNGIWRPQLYSGPNSAPTLLTGPFTSLPFNVVVDSITYGQANHASGNRT